MEKGLKWKDKRTISATPISLEFSSHSPEHRMQRAGKAVGSTDEMETLVRRNLVVFASPFCFAITLLLVAHVDVDCSPNSLERTPPANMTTGRDMTNSCGNGDAVKV